MSEAADDVPNVLMLYVLVPLMCTVTGNYDNSASSMIVMVLFDYLKKISVTKMNYENPPAGGGARG